MKGMLDDDFNSIRPTGQTGGKAAFQRPKYAIAAVLEFLQISDGHTFVTWIGALLPGAPFDPTNPESHGRIQEDPHVLHIGTLSGPRGPWLHGGDFIAA